MPEGLFQTYFPVNKVHAISNSVSTLPGSMAAIVLPIASGSFTIATSIAESVRKRTWTAPHFLHHQKQPLDSRQETLFAGFARHNLAPRKTVMGPVDARAHPRLRGRPFLSSRQNTCRAAHLPGLRRSVRRIGEDMTEMLVHVPGRFKIIRHIREKLFRRTRHRSRRGGADHAIARGRAGAGLLAISSSPSSTVGDALPSHRARSEPIPRSGRLHLDKGSGEDGCSCLKQPCRFSDATQTALGAWLEGPCHAILRRFENGQLAREGADLAL